MIPFLIIMPLAVAGGGVLGFAQERFRRKQLSKVIVNSTDSGKRKDKSVVKHSAIITRAATSLTLVILTAKTFGNKISIQIKRIGNKILTVFTRVGEKSGAFGGVIAAMGCAVCFPALASLGAAIGLGFLTQWEDIFMSTWIPLFAWVALLASALGWLSHRQWHRSVLGMVGPTLVLLSLYPWFKYPWFKLTLFAGLILMVVIAIWDLMSPSHKRCEIENRKTIEV